MIEKPRPKFGYNAEEHAAEQKRLFDEKVKEVELLLEDMQQAVDESIIVSVLPTPLPEPLFSTEPYKRKVR